jgi:hypothetical protein
VEQEKLTLPEHLISLPFFWWGSCYPIFIFLCHVRIFDIPILFCHHLYLSATLKQSFTEFAVVENVFHAVYMSVPGRIPTCDLIGGLFLGTGLKINIFFAILTLKNFVKRNRNIKNIFIKLQMGTNIR